MDENALSHDAGDDDGHPSAVGGTAASLDQERWQMVLAHQQPEQDFVYAVRTTGIYCRPACPSRRPLAVNVTFFDSTEAARAAGYRACLRCRPDQHAPDAGPGGASETGGVGGLDAGLDGARAAVVTACRAMLAHGGPLPAAQLRSLTGLSQRGLSRAFAAVAATSARAFGDAVRTGTARTLLRAGHPVTEAVFASGFGSVRSFYDTAAPTLGMTPSSYAGGAAGERLAWTSVHTPLGTVLAVASARGLCAVRIGEDLRVLLEEVREEFPAAVFSAEHEALADVATGLAALAAGHRAATALPLDLRGSAFQARVWSALTRIPAGQTRSYADVAAQIGAPTAVRAVAGACARNRLALVVPCHRVIRSDGALGGFRWGLQVKRTLLRTESDVSVKLHDSPTFDAVAEHGGAGRKAADEIGGRTGIGTSAGDLDDGADIDVDGRVAG